MNAIKYAAKDRLLAEIAEYSEMMLRKGGVNDQLCAIHALDVYKQIKALNRVQAYKLEKVIRDREDYDPAKDKWGFGPVVIGPSNYGAFIQEIM